MAADIICPNANCCYKGPPEKIARGSGLVGGLLVFFLLPFGIIYLMFFRGYRTLCPRCGLQLSCDL